MTALLVALLPHAVLSGAAAAPLAVMLLPMVLLQLGWLTLSAHSAASEQQTLLQLAPRLLWYLLLLLLLLEIWLVHMLSWSLVPLAAQPKLLTPPLSRLPPPPLSHLPPPLKPLAELAPQLLVVAMLLMVGLLTLVVVACLPLPLLPLPSVVVLMWTWR